MICLIIGTLTLIHLIIGLFTLITLVLEFRNNRILAACGHLEKTHAHTHALQDHNATEDDGSRLANDSEFCTE